MLTLLNKHRQETGFTLIEVMVTVMVVSIGLLGLAGLQINGLRTNMSSEARSKATLLASDIIERMHANPLGVDTNDYANINTNNFNCNANPNPFCSDNSGGVLLVTAVGGCTPAQMATFDTWVWACGMRVTGKDVLRSGVTKQLIGGTGTVVCNDIIAGDGDNCSPGSSYDVTVNWNERSPNATDNNAAGETILQTISMQVVL